MPFSLKTKFNIIYTTSLNLLNNVKEIVFVHEVFDQNVFKLPIKISYLNTEPLNISDRLNYIKTIQIITNYHANNTTNKLKNTFLIKSNSNNFRG